MKTKINEYDKLKFCGAPKGTLDGEKKYEMDGSSPEKLCVHSQNFRVLC